MGRGTLVREAGLPTYGIRDHLGSEERHEKVGVGEQNDHLQSRCQGQLRLGRSS